MKIFILSDFKRGFYCIWDRFDERYGVFEMVEVVLKCKIDNFVKIIFKNFKILYDLLDVLSEIEVVKEEIKYSFFLGYYDFLFGVIFIV